MILLWGAANRDPAAFHNPHSLDLRRRPSHRHLSFGGGRHRCAGASLAGRELAIALRQVLQRFPR